MTPPIVPTRATVVIPTHDHGPTLSYALKSAQRQTVDDLEIFVIGDGVPDLTREIMAEAGAQDPRVRFFDHPKGPHLGEAYRHEALQAASGGIVCYLSDDDLWLPDHVAAMEALLEYADFAHALPLRVEVDGRLGGWSIDISLPWYRKEILAGRNRIPLSCGAHRLDSYRRLPQGWRTTSLHTDLYMWQCLLSLPGSRAVSGFQPTVLNFPSSLRGNWTIQQRVEELSRWDADLSDSSWRTRFNLEVLDHVSHERARWEAAYQQTSLYRNLRRWLLGLPLAGSIFRRLGLQVRAWLGW